MFRIQIGNPIPHYLYLSSEKTLAASNLLDIFEGAFSSSHITESLFFVFDGIFIPIDFDDGCLINELPSFLRKLIFENYQGELNFSFSGQNAHQFNIDFTCINNDVQLEIKIYSYGNQEIENIFKNKRIKLIVRKSDFIAEWKMVLKKYLDLFEEANQKYDIRLENPESYDELKALINAIPYYGILYKHLNAAS